MTGLMDRGLVVRLRSLAVVRKRAGRGSLAPETPGSANEPRMRGPGRAWSSNVRAICAMVRDEVRRFLSVSLVCESREDFNVILFTTVLPKVQRCGLSLLLQ